MTTFIFDAYKGWSEDALKARCRELCRAVMEKDLIIVTLAEEGFDSLTIDQQDRVRRLRAAYNTHT